MHLQKQTKLDISLLEANETLKDNGFVSIIRPFETVFQSISGRLQVRGRKKSEMKDEKDKSTSHPLQAQ